VIRIPLIVANWKMHKTVAQAQYFIEQLRPYIKGLRNVDVALAPSFTALAALAERLADLPVQLAAQNVHPEPQGAFTGEISPDMLKELGCHYVIVGHSERRALFGEDDATVKLKLKAVFENALIPILCVGESLEQRQAGQTEAVLERQLRGALDGAAAGDIPKLVVAYEPIWAIGTGQTATPEDAQTGCAFVRGVVESLYAGTAEIVRVQYGGSVKPGNAKTLMSQPDIDGALVGGASLDADDFAAIVQAAGH